MSIQRINTYQDSRFSQNVLNQHGAFLIEGKPHEVEIISDFEALVRGREEANYPALIKEFRFYTPHITRFLTEGGEVVAEFPQAKVFTLAIDDIQPSQFYVDQNKIDAVGTFLSRQEDIIIQVAAHNGRYISLDGHTRLYYAIMQGWTQVRAVEEEAFDCVYDFADEAQKRGITSPKDMVLLSHLEYEEKWNRYCDDFFATKEEEK